MFSYLQRQDFGLPFKHQDGGRLLMSGIKMAASQAALDLYVTVEINEALH
jgi:hypothetical protein